jgi:taurine dioxygenase
VPDPFSVTPVTPAVGAEITGLDPVAEPLPNAVDMLRRLVHEHGVLFLRGLELDEATHRAWARRFGEIQVHPRAQISGTADITVFDSDTTPADVYLTSSWHTDATFEPCPPATALLRCSAVPITGGDTLWAGMCAAYDALSSHYQRFLDGLEALHSTRKPMTQGPMTGDYAATRHPVVIVDPVTGRRALYVNSNYTERIEGLRRAESDALLQFLLEHIKDPALHVRLHWDDRTLAIWDERITQHCAVEGHVGRRVVQRILVRGETPPAGSEAS